MTGAKICKKIRWNQWCNPFCLKPSKMTFPGTYFGFDICNPKLFALKNRSSIVPSLQNINLIQLLMIRMPKKCHNRKNRKRASMICNVTNAANSFFSYVISFSFILNAKASCRRPKNIKNVKNMKNVKIKFFKNSSF